MRNTAKTTGKKNTKPTRKAVIKSGSITSILERLEEKEVEKLLQKHLKPIHTETDYEQAKEDLLALMMNTEDKKHNIYNGLIDYLSYAIEQYEAKYYELDLVSGIDALRYLMDEHDLTQKDLPEIGSQGVISEILNEKRELNKSHIEKLSKRFNVSPSVFFSHLN